MDCFQLRGRKFAAAGCGSFDGDNHQSWTIKDRSQGGVDKIVALLSDLLNTFHRTVADDCNGLRIVKRIGDEGFQFWEACGVVVPDELVNEYDLVVDGCRECICLGKEMIFWIIFDGANEGILLLWR